MRRTLLIVCVLGSLAASGLFVARATARRIGSGRAGPAAGLVTGEIPPAPAPAELDRFREELGDGGGLGFRIPILMYHRVGSEQHRWPGLSVGTEAFERQMAALAASGVRTLTMDEAIDAVRERRTFPEGAVAVTFDDGTADQYENAFPILRRHGVHATLYVPAGRVGSGGYVTWEQLREISDSGLVAVAAHTITHRDLLRMPAGEAWEEIVGSRLAIEEHLGIRVRSFAYPFGSFDRDIEAMVAEAGYVSAVTTQYGWVHAPERALRWGRIGVHEGSSGSSLAALARRSGDWRDAPSFDGYPGEGTRRGRERTESPAGPETAPSTEPAESPTPEAGRGGILDPLAPALPGGSDSEEPSPAPSPS